ncbi:4Fe-4S cluster-binding domain-containing protein [Candidatus Gracilibacteria bacterium]|nr:4Fe-4S cluster-binding domain-containing protein [Candidatus Gracilibacteria bacterium]
MKYNIILHITTSCNYNCTYCDVVKDGQRISQDVRESVIEFANKNSGFIESFKFFGGEPLLAYKDIEYVCDNLQFPKNYQIVTNTTLLNESIGSYFRDMFKIIFFSIDTEHIFEYQKIDTFIQQFGLKEKVFFNLIISPGQESESLIQFQRLYDLGYRGYNILPVYFTKPWSHKNLESLSIVMKYILDLAHKDHSLKLYGFQENNGYDTSLVNHSLFIDIDGKIYYSDMVSTFSGRALKNSLYIGDVKTIDLGSIELSKIQDYKKIISNLEKSLYSKVSGQLQLHKMMDYFSIYLNRINDQSI